MGRRSKKSPEIIKRFLTGLQSGKSAIAVCRDDPDLPDFSTIWRWMQNDPELRDQYRLANEVRAQRIEQDIDDILDDLGGIVEQVNAGAMTKDAGVIAVHAARLRVDSHKWKAAKLYPRLYGADTQRVEVNHTATLVDELKIVQARVEARKAQQQLEAREMVIEGETHTPDIASSSREETGQHAAGDSAEPAADRSSFDDR